MESGGWKSREDLRGAEKGKYQNKWYKKIIKMGINVTPFKLLPLFFGPGMKFTIPEQS